MITLGSWQFGFTEPLTVMFSLLLISSFLSSVWFVSKRLYAKHPVRALITIALNILAYMALFILLSQPIVLQLSDESIILLTEGAESHPSLPASMSGVYFLSASGIDVPTDLNPEVQILTDIQQLQWREPALNKLKVKGYGLKNYQWRQLADDIVVTYQPGRLTGFTGVQWQRSLVLGQTLSASGFFQTEEPDTIVEIQLVDPSGEIVASVRKTGDQAFSLNTRPRAGGLLNYKLQAKYAGELIGGEPLPTEVRQGPTFNIMIEQSAPSFETRQLKDFAGIQGHRLLINTRISKSSNISQLSTSADLKESDFSPQVLAQQDVLIIDGRTLSQLDTSQTAWLQDAVEGGLGVLIRADSSLLEPSPALQSPLFAAFKLSALADSDEEAVPRLLSGTTQVWQSPLAVRGIQMTTSAVNILVDDGAGRPLVASTSYGTGHLAISLLTHTDRWLTNGNKRAWGELWSAMIEVLARPATNSYLVRQDGLAIPRTNQRTTICAMIKEINPRVSINVKDKNQYKPVELTLTNDRLKSSRQCAFFWPASEGWHTAELFAPNEIRKLDETAMYIFNAGQWLANDRDQRRRDTMARSSSNSTDSSTHRNKMVSKSLDVFWPWLVLILSATLLWLERKFYRPQDQ